MIPVTTSGKHELLQVDLSLRETSNTKNRTALSFVICFRAVFASRHDDAHMFGLLCMYGGVWFSTVTYISKLKRKNSIVLTSSAWQQLINEEHHLRVAIE